MKRVVLIGAGIGGLATAAVLAKSGYDVTVLEAHVYPGGCAGTFYHQGYRFDAGATLAGGFYPSGPMDVVAKEAGISGWAGILDELAMAVHMPSGQVVRRWSDERSLEESKAVFGDQVEMFWRWQQKTADALWNLALRLPSWPPKGLEQISRLAFTGLSWIQQDPVGRLSPVLFADIIRPVTYHLRGLPEAFRLFVDGQLLISAQTTSEQANALYGASALDLPRRGVMHFQGGIGTIAETLAHSVEQNKGRVIYRQEVKRIIFENDKPVAVEGKRKERFDADIVVCNLTPWNIAQLTEDSGWDRMKWFSDRSEHFSVFDSGWGAFTAYIGFDGSIVPKDFPLHQQKIFGEPLGEGNSIFMSLSPEWDVSRAPSGHRTLTISTHTRLEPWWRLFSDDPARYEQKKEAFLQEIICKVEQILPQLTNAIHLALPGTPVTFQRFTRRKAGWVGGFPQKDLFQAWPARLAPGLWMVGDSIFPGQSIAAVALGGVRIAKEIKSSDNIERMQPI